jgi:hypothetical protein
MAENSDKKEIVDALHNKNVLPSLRTYQGDVATFIKSKDQSLSDIALKNREIKEEKEIKKVEEEQKKYSIIPAVEQGETAKTGGTNILMVLLGIFLGIASLLAISYAIYTFYKRMPVGVVPTNNDPIIKNLNSVVLSSDNLNPDSIYDAIQTIKKDPKYKEGITSIEIPLKASDFVNKMEWSIPAPLIRSMEDGFTLGVYKNKDKSDLFMIFKIKDFGIAFRDMLAWETSMVSDLKPALNLNLNNYSSDKFRDYIIKNKDTRSNTGLIYTFLDQKTILITESDDSLIYLLNAFINKNMLR